jgi:hypothetical protein
MRFLAVMIAFVAVMVAAVGALIAGEAAWVGLLASEAQVAEYRFGSEAMIGPGGWVYESQASYVTSGLLKGGGFFAAALLCAIASNHTWRAPNKPLQPTRAAGLNDKREPSRVGPRG